MSGSFTALREKTGRVSATSLRAGDSKDERRGDNFIRLGWNPQRDKFFVTACTAGANRVSYFGSVFNARKRYAAVRALLRNPNPEAFQKYVSEGVSEAPL